MAQSEHLLIGGQKGFLAAAADRFREAGPASLTVPLSSAVLLSLLLGPVFSGSEGFSFFLGTALYVLGIHVFIYVHLVYFHLPVVRKRSHHAMVYLPLLFLIALSGAIDLTSDLSYMLVPYALGAILLTLLFRPGLAVASAVASALLLAHLYDFASAAPVVALAGQILAIFSVYEARKRIQVVWTGFAIAGMNVVLVLILHFLGEDPAGGTLGLGLEVFYGALAGILASALAGVLLPLFENLLDIATAFKIQELSDLDHPLLRNLFLRAPGTYQHSVAVSNLAVTAAEGIGADWSLCRVGTYFHDIGKAEIPEYFAENEGYGGRSRHEDLKPSLSASVIKSHVTQGLKIAEEHGLPSAVCNFIPQHHGKSVIRFFYGKALESQQIGPEGKGEFRYSGPKPQSKETAIVMLADSVEAVSRTLDKPSPSTIDETVRDLVRQKLLDGDLDESNLTLRDLDAIAQSFIKVLNGTFHTRPEYPKPAAIQEAEREAATEGEARESESGTEKGSGRNRKPKKAVTG